MADKGTKNTRDGYGDALLKLGEQDERIVVLDADLAKSTQTERFKLKWPDRFIDCGVAEQNLMAVAAGLATTNKIVFASTFAIFATGRAYDQVRNTISYSNLNVKICATHGGITVGEDGSSHQALEDIALMRVIPRMKVVVPADYYETREAVKVLAYIDGPAYIRLGRPKVPVIFDDDYRFEFGKARIMRPGSDVTILACGFLLHPALEAAEQLAAESIDAEVINLHTIKPLDKEGILASVAKTGKVITCEEHSVFGGVGGAVAELLGEEMPVPMRMIGIRDSFGTSGGVEELVEHFGLDSRHIAQTACSLCR
ncbi:MAG: transketolase [Candidatus Solincola sediminis]|uniref:Transketolase n=1 Tax=Candidatus Solincola sediminis TaxID=1797199 RepID=A0A1F2WPG1_9ACTN|nr:MAG: transketolase [Candidatus Solincola sediminis]OFW58747.1 MAG: transketolase [Candidatus Solincola sediminis]